MSLRNILLTEGLNIDKIRGDLLAIDVTGNISKSYTVNGSLLLDVATVPFNPTEIYDNIVVTGNITKTLQIDNTTLLNVPNLTGTILSSNLDTDAYLTKSIELSGNLLISTTPLITYINNGLNTKINSSLIGANNGIAPLDSSGKIAWSYLPSGVFDYIGLFYFAQSPPLQDGIGTTGDTWIAQFTAIYNFNQANILSPRNVQVNIGNLVIYNGSIWEVTAGTNNGVLTFNTRSGMVIPLSTDYDSFYPLISNVYTISQSNTAISNAISTNNLNYYTQTASDARYYTQSYITSNYFTQTASDTRYLKLAGNEIILGNLTIDGTVDIGSVGSNINIILNNITNSTGGSINLNANSYTSSGFEFLANNFTPTSSDANMLFTQMYPNTQNNMNSLMGHQKQYFAQANTSNTITDFYGEYQTLNYGGSISTFNQGNIQNIYNLYLTDTGLTNGILTNNTTLYVSLPSQGINKMSCYMDRGVGIGCINTSASTYYLSSMSIQSQGILQTNTLQVVSTSSFLASITGTSGTFSSPIICNAINSVISGNNQNLITLNYANTTYQTISSMSGYLPLTGGTLTGVLTLYTGSPVGNYDAVNLLYLTSNYLLQSTASSTYQTISGMSSYSTTTAMNSAISTALIPYLTSSTASSTYLPITNPSASGTITSSGRIYAATNLILASESHFNANSSQSVIVNDIVSSQKGLYISPNTTSNYTYMAGNVSVYSGQLTVAGAINLNQAIYSGLSGTSASIAGYFVNTYSAVTSTMIGYSSTIYIGIAPTIGALGTGSYATLTNTFNSATSSSYALDISIPVSGTVTAYTCNNISGAITHNFVGNVNAFSMNGLLTLSADPSSAYNPVTLNYLQNNYATTTTNNTNYIAKSGGTMTGVLTLYTGSPIGNYDAVNLLYLTSNYSTTTTNNSNYVAKSGSLGLTGLLSYTSTIAGTIGTMNSTNYNLISSSYLNSQLANYATLTAPAFVGTITIPTLAVTGSATVNGGLNSFVSGYPTTTPIFILNTNTIANGNAVSSLLGCALNVGSISSGAYLTQTCTYNTLTSASYSYNISNATNGSILAYTGTNSAGAITHNFVGTATIPTLNITNTTTTTGRIYCGNNSNLILASETTFVAPSLSTQSTIINDITSATKGLILAGNNAGVTGQREVWILDLLFVPNGYIQSSYAGSANATLGYYLNSVAIANNNTASVIIGNATGTSTLSSGAYLTQTSIYNTSTSASYKLYISNATNGSILAYTATNSASAITHNFVGNVNAFSMNGLLTLSADPSSAYNPVTLNYLQNNYYTGANSDSYYLSYSGNIIGTAITGGLKYSTSITNANIASATSSILVNRSYTDATYAIIASPTFTGTVTIPTLNVTGTTTTTGRIYCGNNSNLILCSENGFICGTSQSTIVNDVTSIYKGLVLTGNTQGTSGLRQVYVLDNLYVPNGNVSISGTTTTTGRIYCGNNSDLILASETTFVAPSLSTQSTIINDITSSQKGLQLIGNNAGTSGQRQVYIQDYLYVPNGNVYVSGSLNSASLAISGSATINGGLNTFVYGYPTTTPFFVFNTTTPANGNAVSQMLACATSYATSSAGAFVTQTCTYNTSTSASYSYNISNATNGSILAYTGTNSAGNISHTFAGAVNLNTYYFNCPSVSYWSVGNILTVASLGRTPTTLNYSLSTSSTSTPYQNTIVFPKQNQMAGVSTANNFPMVRFFSITNVTSTATTIGRVKMGISSIGCFDGAYNNLTNINTKFYWSGNVGANYNFNINAGVEGSNLVFGNGAGTGTNTSTVSAFTLTSGVNYTYYFAYYWAGTTMDIYYWIVSPSTGLAVASNSIAITGISAYSSMTNTTTPIFYPTLTLYNDGVLTGFTVNTNINLTTLQNGLPAGFTSYTLNNFSMINMFDDNC